MEGMQTSPWPKAEGRRLHTIISKLIGSLGNWVDCPRGCAFRISAPKHAGRPVGWPGWGTRQRAQRPGAGQHLPRCWATESKYPTCAFLANGHLPCWHSASSNAPAGPGYTLKRQPTKRGKEHTTKTQPQRPFLMPGAFSSLLPTQYTVPSHLLYRGSAMIFSVSCYLAFFDSGSLPILQLSFLFTQHSRHD